MRVNEYKKVRVRVQERERDRNQKVKKVNGVLQLSPQEKESMRM